MALIFDLFLQDISQKLMSERIEDGKHIKSSVLQFKKTGNRDVVTKCWINHLSFFLMRLPCR